MLHQQKQDLNNTGRAPLPALCATPATCTGTDRNCTATLSQACVSNLSATTSWPRILLHTNACRYLWWLICSLWISPAHGYRHTSTRQNFLKHIFCFTEDWVLTKTQGRVRRNERHFAHCVKYLIGKTHPHQALGTLSSWPCVATDNQKQTE